MQCCNNTAVSNIACCNITILERCDMTYVVKTPSRSYIINNVIACIANFFFAILGAFLNATLIRIVWKARRLREKTCYFMLMVLACVDLSVTLIAQPMFLINSIAEMTSNSQCAYKILSQRFAVWLSGMSTVAFFTLSIERYLSIVHSVFHRNHVTKQKCLMFLTPLWIVCTLVAYGPLISLAIDNIITLLAILFCVGTVYMYVAIFYVARRHIRVVRQSVIVGGETPASSVITIHRQAETPSHTNTISHDYLLAKACLLVVFTNLLCHLPNAITLGVWRERLYTINAIVHVKVWTHSLVAINSTLNCIIFFWANKTFRNEGRKIFKQIFAPASSDDSAG